MIFRVKCLRAFGGFIIVFFNVVERAWWFLKESVLAWFRGRWRGCSVIWRFRLVGREGLGLDFGFYVVVVSVFGWGGL